jgi:hypothetical protein
MKGGVSGRGEITKNNELSASISNNGNGNNNNSSKPLLTLSSLSIPMDFPQQQQHNSNSTPGVSPSTSSDVTSTATSPLLIAPSPSSDDLAEICASISWESAANLFPSDITDAAAWAVEAKWDHHHHHLLHTSFGSANSGLSSSISDEILHTKIGSPTAIWANKVGVLW